MPARRQRLKTLRPAAGGAFALVYGVAGLDGLALAARDRSPASAGRDFFWAVPRPRLRLRRSPPPLRLSLVSVALACPPFSPVAPDVPTARASPPLHFRPFFPQPPTPPSGDTPPHHRTPPATPRPQTPRCPKQPYPIFSLSTHPRPSPPPGPPPAAQNSTTTVRPRTPLLTRPATPTHNPPLS